VVNIYRNADKTGKHFTEVAPEDSKLIAELVKDIKKFTKFQMPITKPYDMFTKKDVFKMIIEMLPFARSYQKYEKIDIGEFAAGFKNKFIRIAMSGIIPEKYKASGLIMTLAWLHNNDGGYPVGGSREFAGRIAKKFISLGGKIGYNSRVDKILIDDNKSVGISLSDGTEHFADYIISAADGYHTLYNLLEGKYIDEDNRKLYTDSEAYPVFSSVQVSLGVECDLSKYAHMTIFKPISSFSIDAGGMKNEYIGFKHYSYEPSFAPENCSAVASTLNADYDWWKEKGKNKEAYKSEKERIAGEVIKALEEVYPETKDKVRVVDVATPLTYEKYCNAWRGAWMSNITTTKSKIRFLSGVLKGLDNFFMAGQWIMPPGGLPTAAMTGKWVIQRICKAEDKKFLSGQES
jgi:phytoene desaturase